MAIAGIFALVSPVSADPGPTQWGPGIGVTTTAPAPEEAPANADAPNPSPWQGKKVYSFGGSYVSGFGADEATTTTPDNGSYSLDECFQSKYAGTQLALDWLGAVHLPFSCAGAEPIHIYEAPQEGKGVPAQLDHPELETADAFVFQVRGNPELVRLVFCYYTSECVSSGDPDRPSEYDLARWELVKVREAEEQRVYDILDARNPRAMRFAEGFPKIGPPRNTDPGPCAWFMSPQEVNSMDDLLNEFNDSVKMLAGRNDAIFVDMMRPESSWSRGRHDMCAGPDSRVWGGRIAAPLDPANLLESINSSNHLTIAGQRANGEVLEMTMRENSPR